MNFRITSLLGTLLLAARAPGATALVGWVMYSPPAAPPLAVALGHSLLNYSVPLLLLELFRFLAMEGGLGERVFSVAEAQAEPEVQPDGVSDDLGGESISGPDGHGIDKLHLQEGQYRILYRDCSSLSVLPDVESWRTIHVEDGKTYVVESSEAGQYDRFVCHHFSIQEAFGVAR